MTNDLFNASGCKDLTAYEAMKSVDGEAKRKDKEVSRLISIVKGIFDIAGYEVANRIVIVDKETNKVYR